MNNWQKIYADEDAEFYKPAAGQLYRPSNGTEGGFFFDVWCENCTKDIHGDCPIYARTLAFNTKDAEYPREWIISDEGQPSCTAFEDKQP